MRQGPSHKTLCDPAPAKAPIAGRPPEDAMSVYVDNACIPYRGMLLSHMIADAEDELHEMARALGIDRRHF